VAGTYNLIERVAECKDAVSLRWVAMTLPRGK